LGASGYGKDCPSKRNWPVQSWSTRDARGVGNTPTYNGSGRGEGGSARKKQLNNFRRSLFHLGGVGGRINGVKNALQVWEGMKKRFVSHFCKK